MLSHVQDLVLHDPPLIDADGDREVEPLGKDGASGNKVEDGGGIVVFAAAWSSSSPKSSSSKRSKVKAPSSKLCFSGLLSQVTYVLSILARSQ